MLNSLIYSSIAQNEKNEKKSKHQNVMHMKHRSGIYTSERDDTEALRATGHRMLETSRKMEYTNELQRD